MKMFCSIYLLFLTSTLFAQSDVFSTLVQTAEKEIAKESPELAEKTWNNIHDKKSKKSLNENSTEINSGETEKSENSLSKNKTNPVDTPINNLKAYAKFDFVPGDSLIFEDNFTDESSDEIPSRWVAPTGTVEITKMNGEAVAGFLDGFYCGMYPRMKKYGYLPSRFTLEFDYLFRCTSKKMGQYLSDGGGNNGFSLVMHSQDLDKTEELGDFMYHDINFYLHGEVEFNQAKGKYLDEKHTEWYDPDFELFDKWVHVSISVTETNLKIYLNNQRVINTSISGKPASIYLYSEGIGKAENSMQLFFRNIRIASGLKDPYKQLTSNVQGKFIARGIKFDYNQSSLKPESMGEINRIVSMMKEHPELKFEIGGHTDSDGDAAYNLKLSQQRADAVKSQLVSMGIDAGRLNTKGYGKTKPIADNNTPDGKANNRRVEFVKL